MARFAMVNWGAILASQAPLLVMPVIVALRVSAVDNANFYAAWSAATLVVVAPSMIFQVLLSESSRATTSERVRLREGLLASLGLSVLAVIGSWLARPLVIAAYGVAYKPASELLPVLAAAGIPWSITAALLTEARHRRDHAATMSITLGVGLGTLGLASPLISSDGIHGAARAWVIGNVIGAMCALLSNRIWWPGALGRQTRSQKYGQSETSMSSTHPASRDTSAS
jgi:O-antigen/teichoic acid export membrane protein